MCIDHFFGLLKHKHIFFPPNYNTSTSDKHSLLLIELLMWCMETFNKC